MLILTQWYQMKSELFIFSCLLISFYLRFLKNSNRIVNISNFYYDVS